MLGEFGTYHFGNGNFKKALVQYQEALGYFKKAGEKRYLTPLIQARIAQIYINERKFDQALKLLESTLRSNRDVRNRFAEAETLYHLAVVHLEWTIPILPFCAASESLEITESLSQNVSSSSLKGAFVSNVYDRYRR